MPPPMMPGFTPSPQAANTLMQASSNIFAEAPAPQSHNNLMQASSNIFAEQPKPEEQMKDYLVDNDGLANSFEAEEDQPVPVVEVAQPAAMPQFGADSQMPPAFETLNEPSPGTR